MILAIDIGTSSFKSALWTFDGRRSAFAAVPFLRFKNNSLVTGDSALEMESSQWLRAFEDCCGRLGSLHAVEVIAISGNGPSLTPVLGEPGFIAEGLSLAAAPSRLWLDRRAVQAAAEVSSVSGGFVDPSFYLPKALAIKNDEPSLYEKTMFFLGCPEYLAYALTGAARTVFPAEGFDRWFWNNEILEKLGLDTAKFPPFIRPGDIYGNLLLSAADRFGFARNVPVVAGGPDFFAAILGTGAVSPGLVCDRTGTSEGINLCTKERITDGRLMSYGHPVQPFWNLSGVISTTGRAVEWGRDLLGLDQFEDFFSLARAAAAGAGGIVFLPYLAGERAPIWNPCARGILRGLSLNAGRAEFARSVLEGTCYAARDVIEVMEETGARVGVLHVAGGARTSEAASAILNQMKADITGKAVVVPAQKEAELLGLAIIGACSLGKYASYSEAVGALVHIERRWEPDKKKSALYEGLFAEYKDTRELLAKHC